MRLDDLRHELQRLASEAPAGPNEAATVVRPALRRRRFRGALAGALALIVTVGAVALIARDRNHRNRLSITAPADTRGLTAQTIGDGQWSTIAPAPIAARNHAVVAWAGTQLVVWSGDDGQKVFDDGAAYDPGTDSWRKLPLAPIAGRTMAGSVWTGHELIIWGGDRRYVGDYAADGAAFDPSTWTWRALTAAPLSPRYSPDLIWTGREAIVVGGLQSNTGDVASVLDAAAYDPASNRWRSIAALPGVDNAAVEGLRPVWTGTELLVWEQWRRTAPALTRFGLQLVAYDPSAGTWRVAPPSGDPHRNLVSPVWTGDAVMVPAAQPFCDLPDGAENCGPPPNGMHGYEFDPDRGAWRSIARGPVDDSAGATVWTGDDVVLFSGTIVVSPTADRSELPSPVAAWNPTTDRWTQLPGVRVTSPIDHAFWTGHEILVWSGDGGLRYRLSPPTTATTSPAPSTTGIGQPNAIALPAFAQIPDAQPAIGVSFPWGSAVGAIGHRPSSGQADDGAGPAASAVDGAGNVYVFDQVNWRIVVRARAGGAVVVHPLAGPEEAGQAAVFDARQRLIIAGASAFLVFAPDGRLEGTYPRSRFTHVSDFQVLSLRVRGPDVIGYLNNREVVFLTDRGHGYVANLSASDGPAEVQINVNGRSNDHLTLSVSGSPGGADLNIAGPERIVLVPATRVLPDGSIVAVLMLDPGEATGSVDTPQRYILIRLRPDGSAQLAKFRASSGYMSNPYGPVFAADDNAVSVLSSTTTAGVRVAQYRYADLPD